MSEHQRAVEISVVVPVGSRHADVAALYSEYNAALQNLGVPTNSSLFWTAAIPMCSRVSPSSSGVANRSWS
jgi:hypothetical protein